LGIITFQPTEFEIFCAFRIKMMLLAL